MQLTINSPFSFGVHAHANYRAEHESYVSMEGALLDCRPTIKGIPPHLPGILRRFDVLCLPQ